MEIKSSLEELEKRIAMLRKAAALAKDLKGLKEELEALLTRLLNLESYFEQTEQNKQDIIEIKTSLQTATNKISTLETSLATTQENLSKAEDDIALLQTIVNGIHSEIDLIDDQIVSLDTEIEELDEGLTTVNNQISTINGNISGINSDIEQIENSMITLENSMSTLQNTVSTLSTDFSTLETSVSGYGDRLTDVEEEASSNTYSISTIQNNISSIQGNISAIQEDITALEGSYNGMELLISAINAQFDTVDENIDEIEGNISTLQSSVSSLSNTVSSHTSQISSLNTSVQDMETDIGTLQSNYSTLSTTVSGHTTALSTAQSDISTLENSLSTLSSTVGEHTTALSTHNTQLGNVEDDLESLDDRVTALESGSGGGGGSSVIETFNMGVEEKIMFGNRDDYNNTIYIFFRCEPTARIVAHLELNITSFPTTADEATFKVYLDDDTLELASFTFTEDFTENMTIPLDFSFFPKKNNYRIKIVSEGAIFYYSVIDNVLINIQGRNVMILNRQHELNVQYLDGSYYITKQSGNQATYLVQTTPNLSETGTAIADCSGYCFQYRLYQNRLYTSSTGWIQSSTKYVVMVTNVSSSYNGAVLTVGSTNPSSRGTGTYDLYYNLRSGLTNYALCGTMLNGEVKIALSSKFNSSTASDYQVTLNDVPLENKYVQCVPVVDNFVTSRADNSTAGYILLDNNGELFYLPDRHATYLLSLGTGTQPNAYIQSDNTTINVYYTHCNSLYKKTLVKNSQTGMFELSSGVMVTPGVTEYIEGVNGLSIQKIDGEYVVVQP